MLSECRWLSANSFVYFVYFVVNSGTRCAAWHLPISDSSLRPVRFSASVSFAAYAVPIDKLPCLVLRPAVSVTPANRTAC